MWEGAATMSETTGALDALHEWAAVCARAEAGALHERAGGTCGTDTPSGGGIVHEV